jgi:hypothetical protein
MLQTQHEHGRRCVRHCRVTNICARVKVFLLKTLGYTPSRTQITHQTTQGPSIISVIPIIDRSAWSGCIRRSITPFVCCRAVSRLSKATIRPHCSGWPPLIADVSDAVLTSRKPAPLFRRNHQGAMLYSAEPVFPTTPYGVSPQRLDHLNSVADGAMLL